MNSKFLNFVDISSAFPERKTRTFQVRSIKGDNYLGVIKWYSSWRRYCFLPIEYTVFDSECMFDIHSFINNLMTDRKKKSKESVEHQPV